MSLGNIWIHPHAQFEISKPTLAFIQMPQPTVNTGHNSVAVCQYPYNMPLTTLSKRSNPYEGLDSVEKKVKVPETGVLVQVVPQIASNHIHSPPMVSFQGFDQSLASKPQGYQQVHSWKTLENTNTGGYINIPPQNIATQVYQQVGGQVHQLGGNPVIISNAPSQLASMHVQAPSSFQVMAPTSQAYVIADQANWGFAGNYISHQNMQILNAKNLNLGFQQIQLSSLQNAQTVIVPPQNNTKILSQSSSIMNTGSFHQVKNLDEIKTAKKTARVVASRKDLSQIKVQQNKSEKEQDKKMKEESKVSNEKETQRLSNLEKKEDEYRSAFLKKRKNWKRAENKSIAELPQMITVQKTEIERKNIVLTSIESEKQAETLPFFENKPVSKQSLSPKNSPISVDSAESTTLGDRSSPTQDEVPCS